MAHTFRAVEARVLTALGEKDQAVGVDELARELGIDQSPVAAVVVALSGGGLIEVSEEIEEDLRVGPKAKAWPRCEFPERRVARALAALGGTANLKELPEKSGLEAKEVGDALKWLAERKWASREGGTLALTDLWKGPEPGLESDEQLLARLAAGGPAGRRELAAACPVEDGLAGLAKRAGVVEIRQRKRRFLALTGEGWKVVKEGIQVREEVNELTTEMILSGRWREVDFRAYDVTLPGPKVSLGKEHPFRRILEATRRVYLEMGFEEITSTWVESAFWDFDALFQPQDHPARDMQDTFYLARPASCPLPAAELVDRVRRTHENGGDTGSIGWRTKWNPALAEKCVLRTHTTAATVRALAADPNPPRKVFCVGPVFRREAIDYKHLPVFHQVDGVVIDQHASFAVLLTLLKTFYRKMGFERIQFRPAFFPYTEPSVEVFVWMESRKDWVEMGGAGVFRPEVTEPLGCHVPVLAWGLGLERLGMFRFGLRDIRELYLAHLEWLKETPLCRS